MSNKIYCFSLFCQRGGEAKSKAFVTVRRSKQDAIDAANVQNKKDFPPELGWWNHQISMITISKEKVLLLAAEYTTGERIER